MRLNLKDLLGLGPVDPLRKWRKSVSFSFSIWRVKNLFTKNKKT